MRLRRLKVNACGKGYATAIYMQRTTQPAIRENRIKGDDTLIFGSLADLSTSVIGCDAKALVTDPGVLIALHRPGVHRPAAATPAAALPPATGIAQSRPLHLLHPWISST